MNTKSKIALSVSIVMMLLALATVAIVAVWAITRQEFSSNINVSYTAMQVKGEATARWKVGGGDWQNMTTTGEVDGSTKLTFGATSNEAAALSPTDKNIKLTDENPYVVFEYKFTNNGGTDYVIDLNYTDNDIADTNMVVNYLSSDESITSSFDTNITEEFGNWATTTISASSTKYVYIMAKIGEIFYNASYSGAFNFNLDGHNYEHDFVFADGKISAVNPNFNSTTLRIPSAIDNTPVTTIASGAFADKPNLVRAIIPDSVQTIEQGAFNSGCSSLKYIQIPFVGKTKVDYDDYENENYEYTKFGYIFGADSNSDQNTYLPTSLTNVIITGGTSIADSAFLYCSGITNVIIPEGVTFIGQSAFCESGLTSITIPNSVTEISGSAFFMCNNLSQVHLGSSVDVLSNRAFRGCFITLITIDSQFMYPTITINHKVVLPIAIINNSGLFINARTIKVLKTIDAGTNEWLNNNFSKDTISDTKYNIYTKN